MIEWPYPYPRTPPIEQIREYGLDYGLVHLATGSDHRESKSTLSKQLLEMLDLRDQLENAGQTQVVGRKAAIPDSLIDCLVAGMMAACASSEIPPPVELAWVIVKRLGMDTPSRFGSRKKKERNQAFEILMHDPDIGDRELAKKVGVSQGTARSWREDPYFQSDLEVVRTAHRLGIRVTTIR